MKIIISKLIYPAYVFITMGLYFAIFPYCENITYQILLMAALSSMSFNAIFLHERLFPLHSEEALGFKEKINDGIQTIIIFPIVVICISFGWRFLLNAPLKNFWPHHWNTIIQLGLILIIAEWFHYHYHRFSHRKKNLWKLHTIHHAPLSVYSLNSARFHVLDLALNLVAYAFPLALFGIQLEVQLGFMLINSVTGTLEHANFHYEAGFLNRIFNTGELHRWHHSENRRESQMNLGKVLSIWDQVYGTYFLPKDKQVKAFGLGKSYNVPVTIIEQTKHPFSDKARTRPVLTLVRTGVYVIIALGIIVSSAFASFEGLDPELLKTQEIAPRTRACCNLAPHPVLDTVGLFQFADKDNLGDHYYGQLKKKDVMGLTYTCSAGFIDVAHLRDIADWTAHIMYNLPRWIGSGESINTRNEGGFEKRYVYFPKLSAEKIKSLTDEDYARLAIAISFSLANMHELATGFKIPVSMPVTQIVYERASAFSVEDSYSNLLGAYLGAASVRAKRPYEDEMANQLYDTLKDLDALGLKESKEVHRLVKGIWWQNDILGRSHSVIIRNYGYRGLVTPTVVQDLNYCPDPKVKPLEVPELLADGTSVNDYFLSTGVLNKRFTRVMKKSGLEYKVITQKDYPVIIENLKNRFDKELSKYR